MPLVNPPPPSNPRKSDDSFLLAYLNMTQSRAKTTIIYIPTVPYHFLFCSKMQSGILYLKNYYQKIGLEMEHLKKTGHFFGDNHFYEKLRQKKKKFSNRGAQEPLL